MQVKIEDVSPVEKKLDFEVPWDTVKSKLGVAYDQLAKSVSLKGFRKGKVPKSVIRQMFGKQVRAEVAGEIVRESFLQAVTEHNLEVVSEPHVHDAPIVSGEPFKFHAHVEVRAAIELDGKDYEGLELTRRIVEISDEQVDEALTALQREHTDLEAVEGREVTEKGDLLSMSIKGTIGDNEVDRPQFVVDLDEAEREALPGIVAALTGIPLDAQDHKLELDIPEDFVDSEIAGKKADLTISLSDVRRKVVPELDDEFAKDTGKAETLDELKKVLRDDLVKRAEDEVKRGMRDEAVKELVKRNQIPVAEGLIQRAAMQQVQRLKMMLGMQPDEDPADKLGADVYDRMREGATDDVRGELLIEAVAAKENIEVTDTDVDARVEELASYQGKPANRLRAELDRDGRLADIQFSMRREKALDLLIERAVVTEKTAAQLEEEAKEAAAEAEKAAEKAAKEAEEKSSAKAQASEAKAEDPG